MTATWLTGPALEVVPRLTDGHYDLVFCDGDKREYDAYLTEALRLLRPGGVVAFDNALWHDKVADPAQPHLFRNLSDTPARGIWCVRGGAGDEVLPF